MLIPFDVLFLFLGASILLALAPGPDNIFVLTQSMTSGRLAGIKVTLGLCTGLLVHTALVTAGVSVIFQTSRLAFDILRYAGAAYLVFLAIQAFLASASGIEGKPAEKLSGFQLYRRGIFMNVTNPKVSIFFMAFLPQYTDPARGSIALQMMGLGFLFITATILVFGAVSLLAGTIGSWITKTPKGEIWLNRISAVVFTGLAAKLVFF